MSLSQEYKFAAALPVWEKGKSTEMNLSLVVKAVVGKNVPAVLHIAAHCRYQVFVNGELFAAGPARAAHGFFRVDEYDMSSIMTQEDNLVIIYVAGYNANSYYLTDQPSFICAEIMSGDEVLYATGTDKKFGIIRYLPRVQRVQRYSFQRTFIECYECHATYDFYMTFAGENYPDVPLEILDGKNFITRNVPYGNLDEDKPVSILNRGIVIPHKDKKVFDDRSLTGIGDKLKGFEQKRLYTEATKEVYDYTTQIMEDEPTIPEPVSLGTNCCAVWDMGKLTTGYIRLSVTAQHDCILYIIFNQKKHDGGIPDVGEDACANVIEWSLQGGRAYDLVSFEPYSARYIQVISMYAPVLVSNVSVYREAMDKKYLVNAKAMPDAQLQKIYDAACETFVQNATDIFMDCPSRERAGWLCDSWFTSQTEYELTGRNIVEKNFLENFLLADGFEDIPDGMLPMCYPADHYDGNFIPQWAMWYVLELYEHTKRNNDDLYLDAKERVYELASYFEQFENSDGLLEKLRGWLFVEWSRANDFVLDVNYPTNMLYARFLESIGALYGDEEKKAKAEKVRQTVREQSFDGEFFRDHAIRDGKELKLCDDITETCQYYAFFTGTATKEMYPALFSTLMEEFGSVREKEDKHPEIHKSNAFIGNYLRLILMLESGEKDKLLEDIRAFFLPMAEATGTLWENMDDGCSCNHGFASFVAVILDKLTD